MAILIYATITSLDGFVEDPDGRIDWGAPSEEVAAFVNQLERGVGTYLYGRRMYETMLCWEAPPADDGPNAADLAFAEMWRAAGKIVYSRTLGAVASRRTRMEREFDPNEVEKLKATASADLTVAGAGPGRASPPLWPRRRDPALRGPGPIGGRQACPPGGPPR